MSASSVLVRLCNSSWWSVNEGILSPLHATYIFVYALESSVFTFYTLLNLLCLWSVDEDNDTKCHVDVNTKGFPLPSRSDHGTLYRICMEFNEIVHIGKLFSSAKR